MHYYLYPPFFEIAPETSFDSAWEVFCEMILKLENKDKDIHRRVAPDDGVDIYWKAEKTAYQCKSISYKGTAIDFSVDKAIKSLKSALVKQNEIGWDKYVICTNVDLTGSQEEKIKKVYSNVEFKTLGYWSDACRRYKDLVAHRFNRLVKIENSAVLKAINNVFYEEYVEKVTRNLAENGIKLFLFSNRRREIYEVPVAPEITVSEFISVVRKMFDLPEQRHNSEAEISTSLSYSLLINDSSERIPLGTILKDCVKDGDLVTLWIKIIWRDKQGEFRQDIMQHLTANSMKWAFRSVKDRKNFAILNHCQEIDVAFDDAIKRFELI